MPLTVRVNAGPPTIALAGLRVAIVGAGLLIEKVAVLDVPPPGAGLKTVTFAVPAVAMSVAGMLAVSRVSLTYVVVRSLPFQRRTEPLTKFVPLTVRANAEPPAMALAGLRLVIVGAGLLIEKVAALDVPPPGAGLKTVTLADPAVAMSAAGMLAERWVSLTYVVTRSLPFQRTTEPLTKFGAIDRKGECRAAGDGAGWIETGDRGRRMIDGKGCGVGCAPARRRIEDGDACGPGGGNVGGRDAGSQPGVVDVRGRAITPVPAHDRAAHKVGAIDREGERRAAGDGAGWIETGDRGRRMIDGKGYGVGRAAARRRIEDSDACGPGGGNVGGRDAGRQPGVVDVRGRAITPVPAHDRAAHKVRAIDREGERRAAGDGAGWIETGDRGRRMIDGKGCGVGRAAARRRIEDGDARGPGGGNVGGWDAGSQPGVVDVRGRAITPVPAHDRAAHKVRAIDREGEREPPAMALAGLRLVIVGVGLLLIEKVAALDVPPPGAGLKTVTLADPAVAMSAAEMLADSWVSLTYVVVRSLPFQRTTEPLTKFVPLTVRANGGRLRRRWMG